MTEQSQTDRAKLGLPLTLDFDKVFVTVFWRIAEEGWSRLCGDADGYDGDADEYRCEYDDCIGATLTTLGVPEPKLEGGSLDWLGHLHGLIDPQMDESLLALLDEEE